MTRHTLEQALPTGGRILLDSSSLIAYLDGGEPVSPVATQVVEELVRPGRNPSLVSMVMVMELLVKPSKNEARGYQDLVDFPHLSAVLVDLPVARDAAMFRAVFNLATSDALIVKTATTQQAGYLVTNDARWKSLLKAVQSRAKVGYLADHLPWS